MPQHMRLLANAPPRPKNLHQSQSSTFRNIFTDNDH